jgi:hypothetical protein
VERRPGSGGHRVSTCEEDEQLTAVIQNSLFTTAVDAAGLQNHVAARKIKLTPQHTETRMGYALEYIRRLCGFW